MDHYLRHRGQNADVQVATPIIPARAPDAKEQIP
jgi:chorismate synthase